MVIDYRDKIYEICKNIYEGQQFEFLKYDQYVKHPKIFNHIIADKDIINNLYKLLNESDLYTIERTQSGAIATHNIHHAGGSWDVREYKAKNNQLKGVVITVIIKGFVFVFKCGRFGVNNSDLNGYKAYSHFKKTCKKYNIDLDTYKIDNGYEVKQEIEKPYIEMFELYHKIDNVNHLDLNSAWPAGVCEDYPEFTPVFKELRSQNKLYGDIALGFCQSEHCNYSLSNLAKSGINNCNKNIVNLMGDLIEQDFEIIGLNTDGIWYKDTTDKNRLYTDDNEGTELGQWKTDHKHCEFLAYSNGQYWFRENGKFYPKARGYYLYEQKKPREEWDETDFDKAMATLVNIEWNNKEGFIVYEQS